ncbi:MAG: YhgE/Pip domain-containing protein [Rubrivivax sp.]|jgi:putative membrane protein|nr:YhgE/Pip domain-containing protein [Rubrivivax sp.]
MAWWRAVRAVFGYEWLLLQRHRKLAVAAVGLLFVPALYALIYLWSMWDPASHTQALPAGLVNLDTGARYRDRDLNLGADVLTAIEAHGLFAYRRFDDPAEARRRVREGDLAFILEVPADFSRRAVPGEAPGAAKLTIYTSEGNNYSSAGFARRFAPEVAQRVNTMLSEARWELVLTTAAGSQRNLDTLRLALADLHQGATELGAGLGKAREGGNTLVTGNRTAVEGAARLHAGAQQLAETAPGLTSGLRQVAPVLRGLDARRPSDADLAALRQGTRQLSEGQREFGRGLDALSDGGRQLNTGLGTLKTAVDELPLFGGSLSEGMAPLEDGGRQLVSGLDAAREGHVRLLQATQRIEEAVGSLIDGTQRAGSAAAQLAARMPEDQRLDSFIDGTRELARSSDALVGGLRQLATGQDNFTTGLTRLQDGAGRLSTGLELLRNSLPKAVDGPGGSAQGLAMSVEPVVEVVAPVPNNGIALTPNFVPLALWVGAVMAAFLVHFRRIVEPLQGLPRTAQVAGKLLLPGTAVLLQALLMLAMLVGVLHVPLPQPGLFALTLLTASLTFLLIVFALVRLLGDLGKVVAVLLLIVQVSAAGALLPIQLNDEAFQAMHPYLPLTWVVSAFRASLFGAYDGVFWPQWGVVAAIAAAALVIGTLAGRWRVMPLTDWRPPLDIE